MFTVIAPAGHIVLRALRYRVDNPIDGYDASPTALYGSRHGCLLTDDEVSQMKAIAQVGHKRLVDYLATDGQTENYVVDKVRKGLKV